MMHRVRTGKAVNLGKCRRHAFIAVAQDVEVSTLDVQGAVSLADPADHAAENWVRGNRDCHAIYTAAR
jgi:hypothetical protein